MKELSMVMVLYAVIGSFIVIYDEEEYDESN
jgi:hypothetical protein